MDFSIYFKKKHGDLMRKGKTFIISGPSGVGKSTVLSALLEKHPDLAFSVSATTRPPREGERDGVDYHFIQPDEFRDMIAADAAWGQQGLDLLMVAKYLERIGDHATNVAEWVEYSITGIHPSNN